jgi:hypothetical protein
MNKQKKCVFSFHLILQSDDTHIDAYMYIFTTAVEIARIDNKVRMKKIGYVNPLMW